MKGVLSALGVFALAFCISSTDANEVETELPANFMDLTPKTRSDILGRLDVNGLLRTRKLLPEDRHLIEDAFRKKFKDSTFNMQIDSEFTMKFYFETLAIYYIPPEFSNFTSVGASAGDIWDFSKYFGHCINKFTFLDHSCGAVNNLEPLLKHIQEYVNEFVTEADFTFTGGADPVHPLNKFNFTFPNATAVKIIYSENDTTTLPQIFPAVRSLNLRTTIITQCLPHLPNLERLTVPTHWAFVDSDLPLLKQTLELNPQLKHVTIPSCGIKRPVLSEIESKVESLEIDGSYAAAFMNQSESIRLPNIKVFKWIQREMNMRYRIPFEFGNLEEIEFDRRELTDRWINVLMQNKKLRKVTARFSFQLDNLHRIADGLPNLEEITMYYEYNGPRPVQDIVDFLQRAKQLKKASFRAWFQPDKCIELAEQLKDEWENTDNYGQCCFVRKGF